MKQYLDLIEDILENGVARGDRTGVGTLSTFVKSETYDISEGRIPLVTTRKMSLKTMLTELTWFIRGTGDCSYLDEHGVKIWRQWTDPESNSVGPLYPVQLRNWEGVDQLQNVIDGLKSNPFSRRHVLSYWNVPYLPDESKDPVENVQEGKMALAPCHVLLQFYVSEDHDGYGNNSYKLSSHLYMRSSDVMVGRPFNICQYSILTQIIAKLCGYRADTFTITSGDTHIYSNHIEQAKELIQRQPHEPPRLLLAHDINTIDDVTPDKFKLVNYKYYPPMKFAVAR